MCVFKAGFNCKCTYNIIIYVCVCMQGANKISCGCLWKIFTVSNGCVVYEYLTVIFMQIGDKIRAAPVFVKRRTFRLCFMCNWGVLMVIPATLIWTHIIKHSSRGWFISPPRNLIANQLTLSVIVFFLFLWK